MSKRKLIIKIAKMWPGHKEVNFKTTKTKNLLLLIRDALEGTIKK